MKVEVLAFDGCPSSEALLPHLRELLNANGAEGIDIELVRVENAKAAERERFLGSPTVRIGGRDVEPAASERTDFGLKCRLFATPEGAARPARRRVGARRLGARTGSVAVIALAGVRTAVRNVRARTPCTVELRESTFLCVSPDRVDHLSGRQITHLHKAVGAVGEMRTKPAPAMK